MGKSTATVLRGTAGDDVVGGTAGADIIYGGAGNDVLVGGAGDDSLYGELGNDILMAGLGNDLLDGGDGNDRLIGFDGSDTLQGGAGNDLLIGGAGYDVVAGGAGADTFVLDPTSFKGRTDVFADFQAAEGDVLDFQGLLEGFDPLASAISDFVRLTTNAKGDTSVYVDVDGATNGSHYVKIAAMDDAGALDVDALFASHQILVT